jgi:FSR family fosmidomycin resistance protein-like MFS transporter
LPYFSKLKATFQQWGGGTATFFTYTHFSHDLTTGLLPALLPLIKDGLGLSYLQSGFLLSALNVTSGLSQFPGGWLGDRFKRQVVISIGLAGIGLSTLAVGLSPGYYFMLAVLIIMGIFAGAYHPSSASVLSSYFQAEKRGKAIAVHMVGGSLGFAIGPILGGAIAEFTGWRCSFVLLSLPSLIAIPFILKKFAHIPEEKESKPSTSDASRARRSAEVLGIIRSIAVVFILAVLTQLIGGSVISFIPIYLVDKHGVTATYAAMLIGIIRTGGIAGSLFGGWLSDRWGRINAIFLTFIATGPVIYLFTILPFNAAIIFIFILFCFLLYMRQATVQPYLLDRVPPYLRATVFGIYFGLGMEGISIIQPIFGHFMDLYGTVKVFDVIALISIGLSLLSLALMRKGRT